MYTAEYYLVEIASALIGLSYPFIYQIIENIDKKYSSLNVVRLFKSSWIFKTYNIFLFMLMTCVLTMPFVWSKKYSASELQYPSFQLFSLILLCITLILLFLLFRRIAIFYDYSKLHGLIQFNINMDIEYIPCKLHQLQQEAHKLHNKIQEAPVSEYWISDSYAQYMTRRLERINTKISNLENHISNGTESFRCLIDLILFAIRNNHSDLFFMANSTLGECINRARKLHNEDIE